MPATRLFLKRVRVKHQRSLDSLRTPVPKVQRRFAPPNDTGVDISAGVTNGSSANAGAASMMTSSAAAKASISAMRLTAMVKNLANEICSAASTELFT
jgi:hypothetical protein